MGKLQRNLNLTFMAFQRRIDRSSLHLRRSRMTDKRLNNEINDIFMETMSKHTGPEEKSRKIERNGILISSSWALLLLTLNASTQRGCAHINLGETRESDEKSDGVVLFRKGDMRKYFPSLDFSTSYSSVHNEVLLAALPFPLVHVRVFLFSFLLRYIQSCKAVLKWTREWNFHCEWQEIES